LVDLGLISVEDLSWALAEAKQAGSRLGRVLLSESLIDRLSLYRVLAELWELDFVTVADLELDAGSLFSVAPERLASEGWIPVARSAEGRVTVATSEPPDREQLQRISRSIGDNFDLVATTDWDIITSLHREFREVVLDYATLGLWRRDEQLSARRVLAPAQKALLVVLLLVVTVVAVLEPVRTVVALSALVSLLFLACVLFKFVVAMVGVRRETWEAVSEGDVASLSTEDLPMYTVLVPAYREGEVVAQMLQNLRALDYPTSKLEVILLLEEDDSETMEAVQRMKPPGTVIVLVVPPADPRTKPKACNVGLAFARGEFLVIYDAEDRPDADQLRKAVVAFRQGDEALLCVQAALNYWNADENALTRMFTLEYSYWFDYMLPGLDRLRFPIPLGGTSNHFRTAALREIGGWDPFNVTEDADLGIRVSAVGGSVGVINSTTFEEANRAYGNWIRQRSRWIKGYMQTLLVHLRDPRSMLEAVGWRGTAAFTLLVGGTPFTFLATPPLYAIFILSLLLPSASLSRWFPGWVLYVSLANLLIGNAVMVYLSMMGAFKRRRYELVLWGLLNPLYWVLHSIAAYKALWQLIVKPHYWEKTEHGLSTYQDDDNNSAV